MASTYRISASRALLQVTLLSLPALAVAQSPTAFGSLAADTVELRSQPALDRPASVLFTRAGLPVQILERTQDWARVRDPEGTTGWIVADLLSRRRTALVTAPVAGSSEATRALRSSARSTSDVLAYLEAGVIVGVVSCDGRTCRISAGGVRGFVDQDHLWGVGPGETVRD